jgi:GT2 family glycosyltransferase/tetratricopeptide (TPR) repeat protein
MDGVSQATARARGPEVDRLVASIVIPAWNAWDHTRRCLQSLGSTLGPSDQVVVVDNGSTDGTRDSLVAYPWVEVVANSENRGFAGGCNDGAAKARGDVVVFLNSDTIVPAGWLDELLAPFDRNDVGAVGPCSDNVSGRQKTLAVPDPDEDPRAFFEFAEEWRTLHGGRTSDAGRLTGFCLALRKVVFDEVGGFDERFEIGGFEDDDLCRRVRQRDLRLLIAHGSFVHHRAHASFDANDVDWRTTQEGNRVRFEEKWGLDTSHRPVMVSACLIVKDEEAMLSDCLESVRDVVDEIVVYDTGSSDGTLEIAREAGATVVEGEWADSFATARNAALGHATGEWVLSIDADERLRTDPSLFRAQLADPRSDVEAYLIAIENLHGPGNPRSVHTAIRVFRRCSATWRHRLHEQVVAVDDPRRRLRTAYLSGARLIHHGYIAEVFDDRHKVERNLELAQAALDDDELEHSYALMNVGRALESAGRSDEAIVCLSEAADMAADTITRRLTLTNLVYILGRLGRFDEALSRLGELRQLSRSQVAADIAEGRTRLAMGQTVEGLAILARVPNRARDDDGMEYGPHVVAAICGEALASLGRYGEAADVVLNAVRTAGVLEADLAELVRWLLRAGRSPAEITASLRVEDLVPMLGRVLRQPPPLADGLLEGAWARFPDRLEPLAAAARVAPALPLARALVWSARLRQRGLAPSCPLVVIGQNESIDPVVRVRAAAALHGSFGDSRALDAARTALGELDPEARRAAEEEVERLAPSLLPALAGRPPVAVSGAAAPPAGSSAAASAAPRTPVVRSGESATPTREGSRVRVLDVARTTRRGGLNVVGPFEGTSAEADMVRRLAAVLRERGIPLSTTSYHRDDRDFELPWSHRGPSDFPFDVNLLVVHPDHMTDFVLDSGPGLFHDRYTIGVWIWDLKVPSQGMADAARMVHEVWTPTAWGAEVASLVHPGPVHCVAPPVGGRPPRPERATVGLPEGFVFASSVDYEDGFIRQNPLGVVEAYTAAFSPADGHHLVIDATHADRYPVEHGLLVEASDARPDVAVLRHDRGSVPDRDSLIACSDCYVSLHRADGGLGAVAKAMSWGTFTIVTATAASLEFQTEHDSGLVRSEPVPIPVDEYRYPCGSAWSDPDLQHASSLMRSVVADPRATATKVRAAQKVAARRFSRSVAAAAARARLADIDSRLHPRRTVQGVPASRPHAASRR